MVIKRVLSSLFVFALASGTLLAQDAGLKVAHTTHSGPIKAAAPIGSAQLIFSNFGPAPAPYNDTTGYYVLGPTNSVGFSEQWIGVPFIPRANAHVKALQVAVQWISGAQTIQVGLYSDNGGTVGSPLAVKEATVSSTFGTCCQTVNVLIPSTAIARGSQYWIVASSDDVNAPDFTGVFDASATQIIAADEAVSGWFSFTTNTPAAAAWGTIP
ncbi:MAG TPA: hypothetical protein VGS05_16755 [Candidatus Sulfotelmatobacter sp.]|nr:hypothetical protein [Candidatus Sulfotelmatobacter sp.]